MKTTVNLPFIVIKYMEELLKNKDMTNNQLINAYLSKYVNILCKKKSKKNLSVQYHPRGVGYGIIHVSFQWNSYDLSCLCRFMQRFLYH